MDGGHRARQYNQASLPRFARERFHGAFDVIGPANRIDGHLYIQQFRHRFDATDSPRTRRVVRVRYHPPTRSIEGAISFRASRYFSWIAIAANPVALPVGRAKPPVN